MQKFLTLTIAVAIIYQIMHIKIDDYITTKPIIEKSQTQTPAVVETPPQAELDGGFLEKSLSKVLINILKTPEGRTFFENMIQPIEKPMVGEDTGFSLDGTKLTENIFKIKTSGTKGLGPASCGHVVSVQYMITKMDGIIVDRGNQSFQLGASKVIPALEDIIVGMYVGQTREGVAPAKYAYDNPKFRGPNKEPGLNYKVTVTLENIMPSIFMPPAAIKIFDDKMAYQLPYLCSERAVFDVKISKIDGTTIYDTEKLQQPVSMILGDMHYPMIFSHGLFGKAPIGIRTVVAQGKYLRSLVNKDANKIFPQKQLPEEEFFFIEFKNFSKDGRQ